MGRQAHRLKPHAIDIRVDINPVHWFLNGAADTRSSYYLEDAATEFQIQGLELDWICMTWDADLRMRGAEWRHHSFKGKKWERMNAPERQQYLVNAYRVLLTRARQGMVIFVPALALLVSALSREKEGAGLNGNVRILLYLAVPVPSCRFSTRDSAETLEGHSNGTACNEMVVDGGGLGGIVPAHQQRLDTCISRL